MQNIGNKVIRPTRDEVYMATAEIFSLRTTCGRLNVGAVAVRDNRIIATGYNGPLLTKGDGKCTCPLNKTCIEAIHAEANLIAFAARSGISLESSTLFITHFPCRKCQELIVQSGIAAICYRENYREMDSRVLDFKDICIRKYEGRTADIGFY